MWLNLCSHTVKFSIILEENKWTPRIYVSKIWRFKNEYLRSSNWWRRGMFKRASNRWWMRTLSQSSLHRKWSGSLFTNADKTTSLHFVVFYLYSSRKCRINLDTLFFFLLRPLPLSHSLFLSLFQHFPPFFSWNRSRRTLQAIFVVDMHCFTYPTYFFSLNFCTLLYVIFR